MSDITCPADIPTELWVTFPPAAQAIIVGLYGRIAVLEAKVEELQARLDQNSQNSHKPPSSDKFNPRPKKEKTGKPKGGKPGHPAHFRALVDPERVDTTVPLFPERCKDCDRSLRNATVVGEATRHQVTELPIVRAIITEYQLHRCACRHCGAVTRATLPEGVPNVGFGARFTAFVALLVGRFRLSRREASQLVGSLTDTTISPAGVVKLCARATDALEAPYQAIAETVRASSVVYVDETSNRRAGKKTWLWVAVSETATIFHQADSRARKERHALLGIDFKGTIMSDRYSAYKDLDIYDRAVCHAHLKRDLVALIERGGRIGHIAGLVRAEQRRMFKLYWARENGEMDHHTVQVKLRPLKARLIRWLRQGKASRHRRGKALFTDMWKLFPALFAFVEVTGIEGTNSRAERALRPAVIWRKTCFGTQSEQGDRFVERMLSVAATCTQRSQNLFHFLCDAVEAHFKGAQAALAPVTP